MKLSAVLAAKGNRVFTIDPGSSIRDAIDTLAGNNIGALVVLGRAGEPVGLLSERDIIRAMASSSGAIQHQRRQAQRRRPLNLDGRFGPPCPQSDPERIIARLRTMHRVIDVENMKFFLEYRRELDDADDVRRLTLDQPQQGPCL